jgi:hypothetical protein
LANEFKNIKSRLAQGFEKQGSASRLPQTCSHNHMSIGAPHNDPEQALSSLISQ